VRAESQLAHNDTNRTKIGLITSSNSQLQTDYLENTQNGWNLLMFEDSNVRYATSGIVMSGDDFAAFASPIRHILFQPSINVRSNNNIQTSFILAPNLGKNLAQAIRTYNSLITAFNLLYGLNVTQKALPSTDIAGNNIAIIISDDLIYLGDNNNGNVGANITTLVGQSLITTPYTYTSVNGAGAEIYSSRYGEYMLIANLNDLSTTDINGSIAISSPSVSANTGRAYGLNNGNNGSKAQTILDALTESVQDSSGVNQTNVNVLLVDTDFVLADTYTGFAAGNRLADMNAVLLASGERFSIADTTYTRAYRYHRNGDFRIIGENARTITMDNTVDIAALETQFNNVATDTSVDFQGLGQDTDGNSYFAITSSATSNIDLLENESNGTTLFEEISLSSTVIPEANRRYLRGAFSNVYSIANILSAKIDYNITDELVVTGYFSDANRNTIAYDLIVSNTNPNALSGLFTTAIPSLTTDLRSNVIWAVDFPRDSIINQFSQLSQSKRIESIITLDMSTNFDSVWKISDLTKDPEEWYGNTYNADEDRRL